MFLWALTGSVVLLLSAQAPQWQKVPDLCKQLRAEGWRPLTPESPSDGETKVRNLVAFCTLARDMSTRTRGTRSRLKVFMQHRGGRALSVVAEIWDHIDRAPTLDALIGRLTTLAHDLQMTVPVGLPAAVREATDWEDEDAEVRYKVSSSTRESVLWRFGLKPEEEPLLTVEVSVEPLEP